MRVPLYLLTFLLMFFSCKLYRLPDAKLKSEEVCGYDYCQPGNFGTVFQFYKKPFSPDVDSTTTLRDVATSIIGHAFPEGNLLGDRALTCSFGDNNPFEGEVVNLVNPTGKNIEYTRTEKLELDIEATVEGNLEEIKKLNPDIANLPEVEAKLKAAYSRINNKELNVQAKYSEWGLSKSAIDRLIKGTDFNDCMDFLTEKNYRVITSVGIVSFDVSLDDKSLDNISSELETDLQKDGVVANIGASFKREVNKSLSTSTKGGFQIVVWRHAGTDLLELKK
ncbi:MAG: hypothetical protein ACFHWX_06910 [Bacteroidota bacterium]